MFRTRSLVAGAAFAMILASLGVPSNASAAPAASPRVVHKVGTGSYKVTGTGSGLPASLATEVRQEEAGPDAGFAATAAAPAGAHRSLAPSRRAPSALKGAAGTVHTNPRLLRGFDGLNHRDQRIANNGNQFSLEPPDQALCVGNGHVVEAVNDAFRVYNPDGSGQTGVVDLNTFFGYPPTINRTTGVFGPELTDPTCLYDPTTRRFFLVVLTLEATEEGDLTGDNHLDIAVT